MLKDQYRKRDVNINGKDQSVETCGAFQVEKKWGDIRTGF